MKYFWSAWKTSYVAIGEFRARGFGIVVLGIVILVGIMG